MGTENPQNSAAACQYLLAALLPRLDRAHPGLVSELRAGIAADREAMTAAGKLTPEIDRTISEAFRILNSVGTQ
jgi:hypothetical protein